MKIGENGSKIEGVRHSLAHLLAASVLKKFPDAKLGIGPVVEHGFYYDIQFPRPVGEDILPELEASMRQLIAAELDFVGENATPSRARVIFKGQPFKLDLIKDFAKEKKDLIVYYTGKKEEIVSALSKTKPPARFYGGQPRSLKATGSELLKRSSPPRTAPFFIDLCRGGHVKNTREINPDAFKLAKIAGAYWKGDGAKPQLTRIYGYAFNTPQELARHLEMLEEAGKRDHKKLGTDLDLFVFSDLVGSGLPLWTPKGTAMRNILDDFVWRLRKARGYEQVDIPHITKKELYEKSGHWEKFQDELFKINTREGHMFAMKPMNCPHHAQIYARKQFSYRELPQRYASTTKVYRDEQTGELSGLLRVRAITQDDAHVFCRADQAIAEMSKIWDIVREFYQKCGFPELAVRLSFHDLRHPENYLGKPAIWKKAEDQLEKLVKEKGVAGAVTVARGEAAFYGPKVDFVAHDSLGRKWQVATIQLDMNMPERFDLFCINEKGGRERIVMIHAAIMGSIERFLSILIEHSAGAFPFWLAPVQAKILTISDKAVNYGEKVKKDMSERNIRAELDSRNESLNKKIRDAETQKVPYILVVGEKEAETKRVSVRARGKGDLGQRTLEEFISLAEK